MSELNLNYYDIMYNLPFNHLNLLLANVSKTAYEKNTYNTVKIKKYKNKEVPIINI